MSSIDTGPTPSPELRAATTRPPRDPVAEARDTGRAFEALFLSQVLQRMFAGIPTNGLFGGGPGEEAFRSLLLDEYGKTIARNGGVGIADAVQREILRLQEQEKR